MSWWKRIRFGMAIAGEIAAATADGKITKTELMRIVSRVADQFDFVIKL